MQFLSLVSRQVDNPRRWLLRRSPASITPEQSSTHTTPSPAPYHHSTVTNDVPPEPIHTDLPKIGVLTKENNGWQITILNEPTRWPYLMYYYVHTTNQIKVLAESECTHMEIDSIYTHLAGSEPVLFGGEIHFDYYGKDEPNPNGEINTITTWNDSSPFSPKKDNFVTELPLEKYCHHVGTISAIRI